MIHFIKKIKNKIFKKYGLQKPVDNNEVTTINCKFGIHTKVNNHSYLDNTSYGDFTYSAQHVTIINCTIGKFCSIAQGVFIGLGKHPVNNFVSTHPVFYSIHKQCGTTFADQQYFDEMGTVEIGNDVWIGANAIILDDIKIGNGAMVAANSVVNKDVLPYSIVGGSPAKLIKFRFTEEEIEFLQTIKWWDKDVNWLKENYKIMHDINTLKQLYK